MNSLKQFVEEHKITISSNDEYEIGFNTALELVLSKIEEIENK